MIAGVALSHPGRKLADAAVGVLLLGAGVGTVMATGAAGIRLAYRLAGGEGWVALGVALYLAVATAVVMGMRLLAKHLSGWRYAAVVIGIYAMVLMGLVIGIGEKVEWRGDSKLLWRHVETLATEGYTEKTLSSISDSYDYQVWARRAMPWYNLVYRTFGSDGACRGEQLFHTLVMVLAACLTWRLGQVLFGERVAAVALAFHVLMPWRLFTHLDLAHHIVGSFYYTLGVWILVEWHRPGRGRAAGVLLGVLIALLLPLMRLEGGIDYVFLGTVSTALVLMVLAGHLRASTAAREAVILLGIPILSSFALVGPFSKRIDDADLHHYDSGIPACTLSGWCIETGGQYYGDYQQVDCLTPRDHKLKMILRILASQAYYNPAAVAFRQIPLKMTKIFMAGYASSFEEMLLDSGQRRARGLYIGARNSFLFGLLPCAAGGLFWLLPAGRRKNLVPFVVPFVAWVGAYVVFGESDARYSAYIHSLLFVSAAVFLVGRQGADSGTIGRVEGWGEVLRSAVVPAGIWLAIFALWTGGIYAMRTALEKHVVWDMRKVVVLEGKSVPRSVTLAPFEIELAKVPEETSWGRIALPVEKEKSARFVFYLLPHGIGLSASRGTEIVIDREALSGPVAMSLQLPARVELDFAAGEEKCLGVSAAKGCTPFALCLGYAGLDVEGGALR